MSCKDKKDRNVMSFIEWMYKIKNVYAANNAMMDAAIAKMMKNEACKH
jgi:hypothetical protein